MTDVSLSGTSTSLYFINFNSISALTSFRETYLLFTSYFLLQFFVCFRTLNFGKSRNRNLCQYKTSEQIITWRRVFVWMQNLDGGAHDMK